MSSNRSSRVGTTFGHYELQSLLGRGGMGEVYSSYDSIKDRTVALKLLPPELASDPEYQERFRREARTAARLQEPHVIPIHDFGEIDGVLFIDMRLVNGRDLRSVLRTDGALSPARAVGIIKQVAAALDAAHVAGLVHRDVKPENVLITDNDFAYLADFGIASRPDEDSRLTEHGNAIGSFTYMAPERFDDAPVTALADVYSLGCLLHECLTGSAPYTAKTVSAQIKAHLYEVPPKASAQSRAVPPALDAVLQRALAKDPRDRPTSAGELAREASNALTAPPPQPVRQPATEPVRPQPGTARTPSAPVRTQVARTPAAAPRPPVSYGARPATPSQPYPAYQQAPAPAPKKRRSAAPIILTLLVVAALALAGVVVWKVADGSSEANKGGPLPTSSTTSSQGASSPSPTSTGRPDSVPANAKNCQETGADVYMSRTTSCGFAANVVAAVDAAGPQSAPFEVQAHSETTKLDYTMRCTADTPIVCRGGKNAVIYINRAAG